MAFGRAVSALCLVAFAVSTIHLHLHITALGFDTKLQKLRTEQDTARTALRTRLYEAVEVSAAAQNEAGQLANKVATQAQTFNRDLQKNRDAMAAQVVALEAALTATVRAIPALLTRCCLPRWLAEREEGCLSGCTNSWRRASGSPGVGLARPTAAGGAQNQFVRLYSMIC